MLLFWLLLLAASLPAAVGAEMPSNLLAFVPAADAATAEDISAVFFVAALSMALAVVVAEDVVGVVELFVEK